MSEPSAIATALPPRGIRGSVTVGDYLQTPAAAAVRAVRRIGLCPGLDRQFGGELQSIGLVVAQDPHAGSELARGAMVTLYVSASGADIDEQADGQTQVLEQEQHRLGETAPGGGAAPQPASAAARSAKARSARPRRKRRGVSSATLRGAYAPPPTPVETPPPPAPPHQDDHLPAIEEHQAQTGPPESEPAWDQLTLEMRNVFETGTRGARRRALYPRKPLSLRVHGAWRWLVAHRTITLVAVALLALSLSLLGTRGGSAKSQGRGVIARSTQSARAPALPRAAPPRRSGSRRAGRVARAHGRTGRPWRSARPGGARRRTPQPTPSTPGPAATEVPPQSTSAASSPESQSGGGPFSP